MTLDLTGLFAAAFRDRFGNWAKREEDLVTVRYWIDDGTSPGKEINLTVEQFYSLPEEQQQQLRDAGVSVKVNL